jgi:hypothetical protein
MNRSFLKTGFFLLLFMLTACQTPLPRQDNLKQEPPRKPARSLNLPVGAQTGFTLAGLRQGAVPQGLTLLRNQDHVLTSHYYDDGQASCIGVTDWNTGQMITSLNLYEPNGKKHTGHVGGIVADANSLWIASDDFLYHCTFPVITNQPFGTPLQMTNQYRTEATHEVAFCGVFDGLVWAGEFAYKNKYRTDVTHHLTARDGNKRLGWVCGYDPGKGFDQPARVLSIPDRAQGIYATEDYIFLSISYGRRNRSSIEIFHNPLNEPPHDIVSTHDEKKVPLWFLDDLNQVRSIDLPPMSENITVRDGKLLILFESGADKFRLFGKKPIDQLILVDLEELHL